METILIVDDDPSFRRLLATILTGDGYQVETAASVDEATALAAKKNFHLVLSDLKLPDGDGLDVLRWWAENAPETPVIMITAFGTVASAVEAMKLGAADYLGKPLSSPDELRVLVAPGAGPARITQDRELLREEQSERFSLRPDRAAIPNAARFWKWPARWRPPTPPC